jgi:ABC-type nitrate/sulfonate/bicarbonate transport system substrate-binding protein
MKLALVAILAAFPALSQTKVTIAYPVVSTQQIPLWIAHEQGLFRKQGLEVQLMRVDLGGATRARDFPIAVYGIPAIILAVAGGNERKALLTLGGDGLADGKVVVRPGIRKPEDLRGKRVGIGVYGTGAWITWMRVLKHLGLDEKRDRIEFVEAPPQITEALEAGGIDAAVLDPARCTEFLAKGFSVLLDLHAAGIPAIQAALAVDGAYLREHSGVVEKVVAAMVEGIAFSVAPANRRIVEKTLMAYLGISTQEAAGRGYESFLMRVNRKPYASLEAMKQAQRLIALHDPNVLKLKMEDLIEERFLRKLDESGALDRIDSTYGVQ